MTTKETIAVLHFGEKTLLDHLRQKIPQLCTIPKVIDLLDMDIHLLNLTQFMDAIRTCHTCAFSKIYCWKHEDNTLLDNVVHGFMTAARIQQDVKNIVRIL